MSMGRGNLYGIDRRFADFLPTHRPVRRFASLPSENSENHTLSAELVELRERKMIGANRR